MPKRKKETRMKGRIGAKFVRTKDPKIMALQRKALFQLLLRKPISVDFKRMSMEEIKKELERKTGLPIDELPDDATPSRKIKGLREKLRFYRTTYRDVPKPPRVPELRRLMYEYLELMKSLDILEKKKITPEEERAKVYEREKLMKETLRARVSTLPTIEDVIARQREIRKESAKILKKEFLERRDYEELERLRQESSLLTKRMIAKIPRKVSWITEAKAKVAAKKVERATAKAEKEFKTAMGELKEFVRKMPEGKTKSEIERMYEYTTSVFDVIKHPEKKLKKVPKVRREISIENLMEMYRSLPEGRVKSLMGKAIDQVRMVRDWKAEQARVKAEQARVKEAFPVTRMDKKALKIYEKLMRLGEEGRAVIFARSYKKDVRRGDVKAAKELLREQKKRVKELEKEKRAVEAKVVPAPGAVAAPTIEAEGVFKFILILIIIAAFIALIASIFR